MDTKTFDEFVAMDSRALLRAGWLLTGDWHGAEDLVQTTLIKVWQRWQIEDPEAPAAYARRVLFTTFVKERRRARWRHEVLTSDVQDRANAISGASDEQAEVFAAVRLLPPRQRAAIVLRYFMDLSPDQTAAAMGCSVGAVKSHTARALRRLGAVPELQDSGVVP